MKRQGAIQTYDVVPPTKRIRYLENRVNKIYRKVNTKCSRAFELLAGPCGAATLITTPINDAFSHVDIKVLYAKIRGNAQGILDVMLVSTPTTTAPVYADFNGITGGGLTQAAYEAGFRIWSQGTYDASNGIIRLNKRFSKGYIIPQDSTGAREGKSMWLCVKNSTAGSIPVNVFCEYFYVRGNI